jgi:response regulator RpfG family c-di-GMP phosphodiesterase
MSASPENQTDQSPDQRPLIYAVDDEPMLLELTTMILQPQGFRVESEEVVGSLTCARLPRAGKLSGHVAR